MQFFLMLQAFEDGFGLFLSVLSQGPGIFRALPVVAFDRGAVAH